MSAFDRDPPTHGASDIPGERPRRSGRPAARASNGGATGKARLRSADLAIIAIGSGLVLGLILRFILHLG